MSPDDLWIELAQFDTGHADGLWDPNAATGAADAVPAWYGRVATLLRSAQAPATDDELAGEADIVARMQAAALETAGAATDAGVDRAVSANDGRPRHLRAASGAHAPGERHRGARVVGRIVAVKAAAVTTAVAVGVTAAAATTGIVATVVVPALSDRDKPATEEPPTSPADGGGSGTGQDGGRGSAGSLTCIILADCGPGDPAATEPEGDATPEPEPEPPATPPATTASSGGETPAEPTSPTTVAPSTTATTTPPPQTTTTTTPPTTTTTTEPPIPLDEAADGGDQPPVETMSVPRTGVASRGVPAYDGAASSPAG